MIMKFLSQHHLNVNNMCAKISCQKIYTKKNLKSTNIWSEKFFTIANFDTLPRIEKNILAMKNLHGHVANIFEKYKYMAKAYDQQFNFKSMRFYISIKINSMDFKLFLYTYLLVN